MAKSSRRLARQCVVQALYQWQLTAQAPSQIAPNFIGNDKLAGRHLDYFDLLISEIPAHIDKIDELIAAHLDRRPNQVDLLEQAILRLGTYELAYEPGIPVKVVLNEAVELAKLFCSENGYQYVNAVLDQIARVVRAQGAQEGVGDGTAD